MVNTSVVSLTAPELCHLYPTTTEIQLSVSVCRSNAFDASILAKTVTSTIVSQIGLACCQKLAGFHHISDLPSTEPKLGQVIELQGNEAII